MVSGTSATAMAVALGSGIVNLCRHTQVSKILLQDRIGSAHTTGHNTQVWINTCMTESGSPLIPIQCLIIILMSNYQSFD